MPIFNITIAVVADNPYYVSKSLLFRNPERNDHTAVIFSSLQVKTPHNPVLQHYHITNHSRPHQQTALSKT